MGSRSQPRKILTPRYSGRRQSDDGYANGEGSLLQAETAPSLELEADRGASVESGGPRGGTLDPALAVLVLGAVTVLWGLQHVVIKAALNGTDALEVATLNLLRFGLAAVCFSPWLPAADESRRGVRASLEWRGGAELGVFLFLGFCLQAVGLLYTTAQRSSLLLYLNVKIVPFLALFLFSRQVALSAWASSALALLGTLLVAGDNTGGIPPNVGDALSFAAAIASALFILRLETFARVTDPKALNAVCNLAVLAQCFLWTLGLAALSAPPGLAPEDVPGFAMTLTSERMRSMLEDHWQAVVYLGVVTTAFTNWLQTIGQQSIPATTASVIYALDPLWGCLFAYLFLGEVLGPQGIAGCALLFLVWAYQLVANSKEEADDKALSA